MPGDPRAISLEVELLAIYLSYELLGKTRLQRDK
jgi:hypothetical protein